MMLVMWIKLTIIDATDADDGDDDDAGDVDDDCLLHWHGNFKHV